MHFAGYKSRMKQNVTSTMFTLWLLGNKHITSHHLIFKIRYSHNFEQIIKYISGKKIQFDPFFNHLILIVIIGNIEYSLTLFLMV